MNAVAITDLGNMFGVFKFNRIAQKNNIKPIIGCEFFVSEDRKKINLLEIILIKDLIRFSSQKIRMDMIIYRIYLH